MATYVIGDVQGCFHAFKDLLAAVDFNESVDTVWLVGDMVNRGSSSLAMLRWCYEHKDHVRVVLGNHDLHALVVANGVVKARKGDTIGPLLEADDSDVLLDWLRHQPLMVQSDGFVMLHAGLLPQWTVEKALGYAAEVETVLQSDNWIAFLEQMYGNKPAEWHDDLTGMDRLRVITNTLTRLRICSAEGKMEFKFKGELTDIPSGYMPWFDVPDRLSKDTTILFGHWSALGLQHRNNVHALDTGCLWGGNLTALTLETKAITQVPCNQLDQPIEIKR